MFNCILLMNDLPSNSPNKELSAFFNISLRNFTHLKNQSLFFPYLGIIVYIPYSPGFATADYAGINMALKYSIPLLNAALFPLILILRKASLRDRYSEVCTEFRRNLAYFKSEIKDSDGPYLPDFLPSPLSTRNSLLQGIQPDKP